MKTFVRRGVAIGIPTPKKGKMPIREAIINIDDEDPNLNALSFNYTDTDI